MRAGFLALAAAYTAYALPQATPNVPADPEEALLLLESLGNATFQTVESDLAEAAAKAKRSGILGGSCTLSKLKIRREWGSLSSSQKTAYINAVKCLQSKPANTPSSLVPGAKSRFDDFVATHVNQTMEIHWTGNFLSWHRYYTWLYEKALQDECGYTGTQPYWNWGLTAITGLENSPIFDGSATSMSGNGVFEPGTPDLILGVSVGLPPIVLPSGSGGGCVTSGPFQNMSVNLGPIGLELPGGGTATNPNGPFAYNPRCLKRSLTNAINQRYANVSSILTNILLPQNIEAFQTRMQGLGGVEIGIHGGGHFAMGGDPGRDFFTSPGDPAFYLHHAMIDRVWWIWQSLNPSQRASGSSAISGTRTFLNMPPSADATIDDYIGAGYAGGSPIQIKDALDTTKGPFCYVYL